MIVGLKSVYYKGHLLFLNAPSKKDTFAVIYSLLSLVKLGNSLAQSIVLLEEMETGKVKKYLKTVILLINNKKYDVAKALYTLGFLKEHEALILGKAKDVKRSLKDIIDMREISSNFTSTLLKLTVFPAICIIIGLLIAFKLLPIFAEPLNSINKILELRGISQMGDDGISDFFWYVNYPDLVLPVLYISIFLIIGFYLGYFYLREKNPSFLYRIVKLVAYDDMPFILLFMRALNRTGMVPLDIAEELSRCNIKSGWKPLFKNIKNGIKDSQPLYNVLEKFYFPKEVTLIVKSAEIGKSFWENMDGLIQYTVEKNENGNKLLLRYFGGLANLIGYSIVIYFLIGIFIIMLQIQTVSTAIMN